MGSAHAKHKTEHPGNNLEEDNPGYKAEAPKASGTVSVFRILLPGLLSLLPLVLLSLLLALVVLLRLTSCLFLSRCIPLPEVPERVLALVAVAASAIACIWTIRAVCTIAAIGGGAGGIRVYIALADAVIGFVNFAHFLSGYFIARV